MSLQNDKTRINMIRNFGFIAHIDAGKTTTTERILYLTGANSRSGEVDEGTATTDYMIEEKERGITIKAAGVTAKWKDHYLHIIDTPGHIDFTSEVERSLRVLDGAVVIVCGISGVQVQTETVCRQSDSFKIPKIFYVNKLDRDGADFNAALDDIRIKLGYTVVPLTIPHYKDNGELAGIIDLVNSTVTYTDSPVPHMFDIMENGAAAEYREQIDNTLGELSDEYLNHFMNNTLNTEIITRTIKELTAKRLIVPVLSGSSKKSIGLHLLLDNITGLLPSPLEAELKRGFNSIEKRGEELVDRCGSSPLLYIFKIIHNRELGALYFARVYSGILMQNATLFNPRTKLSENINAIFTPFANMYEPVDSASTGDIIVITGLKSVKTGDTLSYEGNNIILERLHFPEPVIFCNIALLDEGERDTFNRAKSELIIEDPTLRITRNPDTGESVWGGMGELQLEIIAERLRNEYRLHITKGNPGINYKEAPKSKTEVRSTFNCKYMGEDYSIEIIFDIDRSEDNLSNIYFGELGDFSEYRNFIEDGFKTALKSGKTYPFAATVITLKSINSKKIPDNGKLIEAASCKAVTDNLAMIETVRLEPVMRLEIYTSDKYTGVICGDILSRKGSILNIEKKRETDVITAVAPLCNLIGYATDLRSLTGGRGALSMNLYEYRDKM